NTARAFKKKVWDQRSKKDLVDRFYAKYKYSKAKLLQWVGLASSSYYYRPKGTRKGNRPSKYTLNELHGWVKEETVIESIKEVLSRPFIDCGYHINGVRLKLISSTFVSVRQYLRPIVLNSKTKGPPD